MPRAASSFDRRNPIFAVLCLRSRPKPPLTFVEDRRQRVPFPSNLGLACHPHHRSCPESFVDPPLRSNQVISERGLRAPSASIGIAIGVRRLRTGGAGRAAPLRTRGPATDDPSVSLDLPTSSPRPVNWESIRISCRTIPYN